MRFKIFNAMTEDRSVSLGAMGLMTCILSMAENGMISVKDVLPYSGCGEDKYRKLLKELSRSNWVQIKAGVIYVKKYTDTPGSIPIVDRDSDDYYLSEEWKLLSSSCLKRDKYTCQECGVTGNSLVAHHIIWRKRGGPDELDNLVTMCKSCHSRLHINEYWKGRRIAK